MLRRSMSALVMPSILAAWMLVTASLAAAPGAVAQNATAQAEDLAAQLAQADKLRAEGSFRAAREAYDRIIFYKLVAISQAPGQAPAISADDAAHARVLRADCLWRERRGGDAFAEARKALARLVEDLPADSRWRAEAAESLADLIAETGAWWNNDDRQSAVEDWIKAIDYWGHAEDLASARPRYVALNFKLAEKLINQGYGGPMPLFKLAGLAHPDILPPPPPKDQPWHADVASWALRNVLRVSQDAADQAHARLLLGRQRMNYPVSDAAWNQEAEDELKQAAALRPVSDWTDDAMAELARYYENHARFVEAAKAAENFLAAFKKGQSPFWDDMLATRNRILEPQAGLSIADAFAPGSYLKLDANYRNLSQARLVIRRVQPEALEDAWRGRERPRPDGAEGDANAPIDGKTVYDRPIEGMTDDGKHAQQSTQIYVEPLGAGVYRAEVVAKVADASTPGVDQSGRYRLFQVSGLAVAAKHVGRQSQAWVADADGGKPVSGARVRLVFHYQPKWNGGNRPPEPRWHSLEAVTDKDGLAGFERPAPDADEYANGQINVLAIKGAQAAWIDQNWFNAENEARPADQGRPVLYAWTDRPAYRPGDVVHWKALLRFSLGQDYRMPTAKQVHVFLRDERGNAIEEKDYPVDSADGSIHGQFTPTRQTALGIVRLEIRDAATNWKWSQSAQLCRLEEYKLPEFKVAVEPPAEQSKFGAAMTFNVAAEYYAGGPVAGAKAQLVVHRQAFWPSWHPAGPYDWLYGDDGGDDGPMAMGGLRGMRGGYGMGFRSGGYWPGLWRPTEPEAIVLEKTVALDKTGKAAIDLAALTPDEIKAAAERGVWGYAYRVEARVTDASRREVMGDGSVKVARQAFAAYLNPERFVYLPGDKAKIDLATLDPNDRPVRAEGLVTIYKRTWNKDKPDAKGRKVGGYDDEELLSKAAATDAEGKAVVEFEPERDGYYLFRFKTQDKFGQPVAGETTVFVCSAKSDAVGYRCGGVEIILDKKSYRPGETAQALVTTRRPGVAVWLAVEAEAIHQSQVIRLDGTAKLVAIPIKADFEPNAFVTAVAMFDYSGYRDQKMLLVPPAERLLDVSVKTAKADYRPGEKTKVEVEVKDAAGRPVATRLALGVADAATWAIQGDLADDIRRAFWSQQRGLMVQAASSVERYAIQCWKPVPDKPGQFEQYWREGISWISNDRKNKDENGPRAGVSGVVYDADAISTISEGGGGGMAFGQNRAAKAPMLKSMSGLAGAMSTRRLSGNANRLDLADAILPAGAPAFPANQYVYPDAFNLGAPPRVRSNFAATAFWQADIQTDAAGHATASLTWPDSLTTWRAVARAADAQTRVGQASTEVKTNKLIMIRPQAPRFFVQGDQATVSAVVVNDTASSQTVKVDLAVKGVGVYVYQDEFVIGNFKPEDPSTKPYQAPRLTTRVGIPANAQRRVDWPVTADAPGTATIKIVATGQADADAVQKSYPILEYGSEQFLAVNAAIRVKDPVASTILKLDLPANRRVGTEKLVLHVEPTLARAMADALPFLADYPYGCVEQTLSRFVPAVIVKKTLDRLGIENKHLAAKLPDMVGQGLDRLDDFQHADGGWGWWKEGDSDPYMTAYVLAGLAEARAADVSVKQDVLDRAAAFLAVKLVDFQGQPDMTAFALYALAAAKADGGHKDMVDAAYDRLWPQREKLNAYTRALFALACHGSGRAEWAGVLVRNMRNGLVQDKANGTAHWGKTDFWWHWSDGGVEGTAFSLRALLAIDPQNDLIDPAMTWLVRNRRGARWTNARDTAIVVGALADYVAKRGEDRPDWTAEVRVNGELVKTLSVKPGEVFAFDGEVEVPARLLKTGRNAIEIVRRGTGVLYASAWLTFFNKEEKIPEAGNEVFIHRRYFMIADEPTLSGQYKQARKELKEGDALVSGQRVEVELRVEAKNDYEYLVIEDPKAAGLEPVDLQSGWAWNPGARPEDADSDAGSDVGVGAHRELRDEKVAFFLSRLAEGRHVLRYVLRAEIPGKFHALPARIEAMYVPEIRGNSRGYLIGVTDKK